MQIQRIHISILLYNLHKSCCEKIWRMHQKDVICKYFAKFHDASWNSPEKSRSSGLKFGGIAGTCSTSHRWKQRKNCVSFSNKIRATRSPKNPKIYMGCFSWSRSYTTSKQSLTTNWWFGRKFLQMSHSFGMFWKHSATGESSAAHHHMFLEPLQKLIFLSKVPG